MNQTQTAELLCTTKLHATGNEITFYQTKTSLLIKQNERSCNEVLRISRVRYSTEVQFQPKKTTTKATKSTVQYNNDAQTKT